MTATPRTRWHMIHALVLVAGLCLGCGGETVSWRADGAGVVAKDTGAGVGAEATTGAELTEIVSGAEVSPGAEVTEVTPGADVAEIAPELDMTEVTPGTDVTEVAPGLDVTDVGSGADTGSDEDAGGVPSGAVVADHLAAAAFDGLDPAAVAAARAHFRVGYGHTSHGGQITTGMCWLQSTLGDPYLYNADGAGGALDYTEFTGIDLGHNGDLAWEQQTRQALDGGADFNLVMWSWCGGVSDNTAAGIDTYLSAMAQLEVNYPGVIFVYMTGHMPDPGCAQQPTCVENTATLNQQIRDYCLAHDKVLFDFEALDRHDPDGVDHPTTNDGCQWCHGWCVAHPDAADCQVNCDAGCGSWCAHTHCLNCMRKGKAFWWLLTRLLAG